MRPFVAGVLLTIVVAISMYALMTGMRKLAHPHGGLFQFEVDLPACEELCQAHGGVYTWTKKYDRGPPSSQISTYCECDR